MRCTLRAARDHVVRAAVRAARGGRKGTAVHFVRPVLQLGLRKVVGGTQLNVLRAAVTSEQGWHARRPSKVYLRFDFFSACTLFSLV